MNRKFLLRRDPHDSRDLRFKVRLWHRLRLPSKVDLRKWCSPIEDQGELGSCGPNAGVGLWEYLMIKVGNSYVNLSRLFWYWTTRKRMGTLDEDSGVNLRDLVKAGASEGICSERSWPYSVEKFQTKPTPACFGIAFGRRIKGYRRVVGLQEIKSCLAGGTPVLAGIKVFSNMLTDETAKSGLLDVPGPDDEEQGGHAVLFVGYDDSKAVGKNTGAILVRNSWGAEWGLDGYFWLSYAYLGNHRLMDCWTFKV